MDLNPTITVIHAKDVVKITRRTERAARLLLKRIRTQKKKKPHQFVTVQEFCEYTGLGVKEVMKEVG